MAKAGGRAGRMFSSGRLAGPVVLPNTKRRTTIRKMSSTSADSGYSLYSTDSEDQVLVINKGLDRCAALLQDILQSEVKENTRQNPSCRGNARQAPLKVKRSAIRKTASACHTRKAISTSQRKSGPFGVRDKGVKTLHVSAPQGLASPHTPIMQPALCEHIQTQMSRLAPGQGPDCAPLYNCRLPTSTPALSPRNASNVQNFCHDALRQVLPQGEADRFPSGIVASAGSQAIPPVMYVPTSGQCHPLMPTDHQQPCQTDSVSQRISDDKHIREHDLLQHVAAHLAQLQVSGGGVQTLHKAEYFSGPVPDLPAGETDEVSSIDEDNDDAAANNVSSQTSFKNPRTSPDKKIKMVKYLLREIKALVSDQDGEAMRLISELEHSVSLLPAAVGNTNFHAELALALQPLRSENAQLRRRLRILNQQLRDRERNEKGARSDTCNAQMVSLQAWGSLQRQLTESQKELQSVQSKSEDLLRVIEAQKDEQKKLAQIAQEKDQELRLLRQQQEVTATRSKTDLEETLGKMKILQIKFESSEKDNRILEVTVRQRDADVSRLSELTRTLQGSMAKLLCDLGRESSSKAKSGPNLTRALLDSYEKQLQEENIPASTSIISYLKQLETDRVLPSLNPPFPSVPEPNEDTSTDSSPCLIHPNKDLAEPDHAQPNHHFQASHTLSPRKNPSDPRSVGSVSAYPKYKADALSPRKHRPESRAGSCLSTYDEYKPDETTYLPLTSSPHKAQLLPSQRHMCTPPMADTGSPVYDDASAYSRYCEFRNHEDTQNGGECGPKKTLQTSSNKMSPKTKPDEGNPRAEDPTCTQTEPKPSWARYPLAQEMKNSEVREQNLSERSMFDLMSGRPDWTMTSFSTFTSHDEQDFRNGLAALDANIAKLQQTLQVGMLRK